MSRSTQNTSGATLSNQAVQKHSDGTVRAKALSLIYGDDVAVGARPNLAVILPPPPPDSREAYFTRKLTTKLT